MGQETASPGPLNATRPDLLNIDVIKHIAVKIAPTADPENLHANQTSAGLIRGFLAPHSVLCELHPLARSASHRDRVASRPIRRARTLVELGTALSQFPDTTYRGATGSQRRLYADGPAINRDALLELILAVSRIGDDEL
jgi:hypothetical protein